MNVKALIDRISKAKKLEDVLDINQLKSEYREAVKALHPDLSPYPEATNALIRLNHFMEVYEKGKGFEDDAGPFKVTNGALIYFGERELLETSYRNFTRLTNISNDAARHFRRYLPSTMAMGTDLTAGLADRAVPLSGLSLPQKHVNWILSRMLEVCSWFAQEGFVHAGINPESVLVVPETHGIIIGSFYHMSLEDGRLKSLSAKYKNWYPETVFKTKRARTIIDLELCKRVAAYLLGDKSGMGIKLKKTHNKEFIEFLLDRHTNAYQCYQDYRSLLDRNFEKKFYPLDL